MLREESLVADVTDDRSQTSDDEKSLGLPIPRDFKTLHEGVFQQLSRFRVWVLGFGVAF